jgi:hypothetical protein
MAWAWGLAWVVAAVASAYASLNRIGTAAIFLVTAMETGKAEDRAKYLSQTVIGLALLLLALLSAGACGYLIGRAA